VNIALCQTLAARLARPAADDTSAKAEKQRRRAELTRALLSYFEFVIGEEAHEVGGAEYYEIMAHCRNALYRLALTATPFMRPDGEANMRLQAAFGSIGIQISEKLLIDRGILATPYFKLIDTPAPAHLRRTTRWPTCYDIGIVENAERNGAIAREVVKGVRHSLPVMVLIQREKHGHILNDLFTKAGARSAFISGKHEQEQRQRALSDLANHNLDVLIGSTILDVGVDVPAVGMVGIAGGGKGEIGHRQRIGRGLEPTCRLFLTLRMKPIVILSIMHRPGDRF
jgi:superfamily II DNA or RNA helicase